VSTAKKKALIVWGGWDGHEPEQVANLFSRILREDGFSVEVNNTLDAFNDEKKLLGLDLIVPIWTMGKLSAEQANPIFNAVRSGVGVAGSHGGMCDAFREQCEWQFMTGGQFVAHPGSDSTQYKVYVKDHDHPITRDVADFEVRSEQYYMHVDPANHVLATTLFPIADGPHVPNGLVEMPVVWIRRYGAGKVFYNSLGHNAQTVALEPCLTVMRRGFAWAAR
jgi:type 1 glutamine amidotransferase